AAALLFGLGHAQIALNQGQEAVSNLTRAFHYYAASADVYRAIAIAQNSHSTQLIFGMREAISQAIQLVPSDSLQAGHILANHGYCLGLTIDGYEEAQRAFEQALSIARRHNDAALEMRVLANSGNIDGFHMRWEGSLARSLQALELSSRVDDAHAKMRAHLWALLPLLFAEGDLEAAGSHSAELLAMAERLHDGIWTPRSLNYNIELCCVIGDWRAARNLSDQSLGRFPRSLYLLGQRALLEYQTGDFTQGQAWLDHLLGAWEIIGTYEHQPESSRYIVAGIPLIARITGAATNFELVQIVACSIISSPYHNPYYITLARCGLALIASHLGDVVLAAEQYAALVSSQRRTLVPLGNLAVERVLGILAQTVGNLDPAADHFEDALAFCHNRGYRPELAWTCCDYADTLLQRNNPGDRERARALLDESLAISTELGMRPLLERVQERLDRANLTRTRATAFPSGLTEREVEVLRLVAAGKSNREIADELIISLRTVANHVANILTKTNSANRAEAASFATREGLA
ncbi:MAG: LuxR C-terminal-related transcriptional regulator, partial [Dehalococcoidia bacterium]